MRREEVEAFADIVAEHPEIGDIMQGTGGCRKVRFGERRKGKSEGCRIVTFFSGADLPVFSITVFARGEKADLTRSGRNALGVMSARHSAEDRNNVACQGVRR